MSVHPFHANDHIATIALERWIPEGWLVKSAREIYSTREYGDDLLIEIVDADGNFTGAQFYVQNKVGVHHRRGHVSLSKIRMTTVRRLLRLSDPVLFHGYDRPNETSYWIWLDEWYQRNYVESWESQREVTIRIPKSNVLNHQSIRDIEARVLRDSHALNLNAWASAITRRGQLIVTVAQGNQASSDIRSFLRVVDDDLDGDSTYVTLMPLVESAIPEIQVNSVEVWKAIDDAVRHGLTVVIEGEMSSAVNIGNLPPLPFSENVETRRMIFGPTGTRPPIHVQLRCKKTGVSKELISYLEMECVQPGTHTIRYSGRPPQSPAVKVDLLFERTADNNYLPKIELSLNPEKAGFSEYALFGRVVREIADCNTIAVHIFDTDADLESPIDSREWDSIREHFDDWVQELSETVAKIEVILGMQFNLPAEIDSGMLEEARRLYQIVSTGILSLPLDTAISSLEGPIPVGELKKWVEILRIQNEFKFVPGVPFVSAVEFLGHTIQLGRTLGIVTVTGLEFSSEVSGALERLEEMESVRVKVTVDKSKGIDYIYEEWLDENDRQIFNRFSDIIPL